MYILAIDTATNSGGVAVSRNQELIGQVVLKTPLRYSDTLIPMLDFLLGQLDLKVSEIGLLVAAAGPGSFTGLRIGLATLKGIAHVGKVPCVGVSTLEALAHQYRFHERLVVPMMDARRQQVYSAVFRASAEGFPELLTDPVAMRPDRWLSGLDRSQSYLFVGDGSRQYRSAVESALPEARILGTDNQLLEALCLLGYQKLAQGDAVSASDLKAIYVRPPDVRKQPS